MTAFLNGEPNRRRTVVHLNIADFPVARRMRRRIRKRFGLVPIWSVASNKLVSKVATRLVKPVGEYVVGEGEEGGFISPLPLVLLPGIEKNDRRRLADLNLSTAGQVAGIGEDALAAVFGKHAAFRSPSTTLTGCDAAGSSASAPLPPMTSIFLPLPGSCFSWPGCAGCGCGASRFPARSRFITGHSLRFSAG